MHRSDDRSQTNSTTNHSSFGTSLCELGALARNPLLTRFWLLPGRLRLTAKAQRTRWEEYEDIRTVSIAFPSKAVALSCSWLRSDYTLLRLSYAQEELC
jgi:hypothetical protein